MIHFLTLYSSWLFDNATGLQDNGFQKPLLVLNAAGYLLLLCFSKAVTLA
jgi:hypothetical protein